MNPDFQYNICVVYFDIYLSYFCERISIKIFMDKVLILILEYIYILYVYLLKIKFRLDLIINLKI